MRELIRRWCVRKFIEFFYFYKQKTAYEMRISDWSSDVCSSDLNEGVMNNHDAHNRWMKWPHGDLPQRSESATAESGAGASQRESGRVVTSRSYFNRSAERRVGKECGSRCRYRGSPYHKTKNISYKLRPS